MNDVTSAFLRIKGIISEELGSPDIELTPEMVARDVEGWDSIAMVNIIIQVQESFNIRFTPTEIDQLHNVGDFASKVAAKIRE